VADEQAFPPAVKYVWVCPVCRSAIVGTYNVDPLRKKCSKTWHRAMAERVEYVWSRLAVGAVAQAMRNGQPDDGSDADEAIADDARLALAELIDAHEHETENEARS
jgi:hypothetical protein